MAWTTEQKTALEEAIASGVLTVRYADRTVTYQSTEAMLKVLKQMNAQLNPKPRRRLTTRVYQSGRGF